MQSALCVPDKTGGSDRARGLVEGERRWEQEVILSQHIVDEGWDRYTNPRAYSSAGDLKVGDRASF